MRVRVRELFPKIEQAFFQTGTFYKKNPLLRRLHRERILSETVLFNRDFYEEKYSDVSRSGLDPVDHYMLIGADRDMDPGPAFKTGFYRRFIPVWRCFYNPLVHYIVVGSKRGFIPTPYYNEHYYLLNNPDAVDTEISAFQHFYEVGIKENRNASPLFDPHTFLSENPDLPPSGFSAFEWFLIKGEFEDWSPLQVNTKIRRPLQEKIKVAQPDHLSLIMALPDVEQHDPDVVVIIPCFRGVEESLNCIHSVLGAKNQSKTEVLIINDCTPEPALDHALEKIAETRKIRLIKNEKNLGFVRSINIGLALYPNCSAIILNSDTEVYGDWVDRILAIASQSTDIGTITPLTNNGEICSYPNFVEDNERPLEVSYREVDAIAANINEGSAPVDAPTGVGFCMYVRRTLIEEIGDFDSMSFGVGYGEENDFCQRAIQRGWRNVIATNIFVHHKGATSFKEKRHSRIEDALKIIGSRYPKYNEDVGCFIKKDPVRQFRAAIDWQRLRLQVSAKNRLVVSHLRGGGTERAVQGYIKCETRAGVSVFRAGVSGRSRLRMQYWHENAMDVPNLDSLRLDQDHQKIVETWQELGIGSVDIHHLIDFGRHGALRWLELLNSAGLPWRVFTHDYYMVCPRTTLTDETGNYCGEPGAAGCRECIANRSSEVGNVDIEWWRHAHYGLLAGAVERIVPNRDVATRMARYFPDLSFTVLPHEEDVGVKQPSVIEPARPGDVVRVATLGAISAVKGFDVLRRCAALGAANKLPLEITVIGYTKDDQLAHQSGMRVTGPYDQRSVQAIIEREDPHLIFLPSRWPETYSFTLSEALQSGRPVVAFDIGAIQARIRDGGYVNARLLPMETTIPEVIDALMDVGRGEWQSPRR